MQLHRFTSVRRRAFITSVETNHERTDMKVTDRQALYEQIAKRQLGFETLVTRKSDALDFRDVSVWAVKAALEEAFQAGVAHGLVAATERRKRDTD
jgi:hypothetical protein